MDSGIRIAWEYDGTETAGCVPEQTAMVSVFSHALHYGTAVFEGIRAYPLRTEPTTRAIFRLSDHLVRLASSAMILKMPFPCPHTVLAGACAEVLAANAGFLR